MEGSSGTAFLLLRGQMGEESSEALGAVLLSGREHGLAVEILSVMIKELFKSLLGLLGGLGLELLRGEALGKSRRDGDGLPDIQKAVTSDGDRLSLLEK